MTLIFIIVQSNENSWMFTNIEPHESREIPKLQYKPKFKTFLEKSQTVIFILSFLEFFFETFWIFFWNFFLKFFFEFFFEIFLIFLKFFLWFCFRCPGHSVWARYFYISKVLVSGRDLWLCLFDFWKFFDFELEVNLDLN